MIRDWKERFRLLSLGQKFSHGFLMLVAAVVVFILGYAFVYEPIKFRYLIWKIESARTPEEEKQAFLLATRWGRVFEWNWVQHHQLPEKARHIQGNHVLRLEWLESASWNGHAYEAYRIVLDEANVQILSAK